MGARLFLLVSSCCLDSLSSCLNLLHGMGPCLDFCLLGLTVFLRCFYGGFSIFINSARGFCGESLIFIGCIVWNDDDAVGNEWTPQLSYLLRILPTVASRYLCIEFEFVSKHLTAAVEIAIGTLRFHGKGRVISILDFMSSFWFQLDALERSFLTSKLVPGFQGALGPTAAFAFWYLSA